MEAVGGRDDLDAEACGHVLGMSCGVCLDEGHAEVGEDGEFGVVAFDDLFGFGDGEVVDAVFFFLKDDVDDEDV